MHWSAVLYGLFEIKSPPGGRAFIVPILSISDTKIIVGHWSLRRPLFFRVVSQFGTVDRLLSLEAVLTEVRAVVDGLNHPVSCETVRQGSGQAIGHPK